MRKKKASAKKDKGKTVPAKVYVCHTCGKVSKTATHLCMPRRAAAYVCQFCGKTAAEPYHVCVPLLEQVKYYCRNCGRVSPQRSALCRPRKIK